MDGLAARAGIVVPGLGVREEAPVGRENQLDGAAELSQLLSPRYSSFAWSANCLTHHPLTVVPSSASNGRGLTPFSVSVATVRRARSSISS